MKLLPNLALAVAEVDDPISRLGLGELLGDTLTDVDGEGDGVTSLSDCVEPNRLLPAKSCLLDFLVVVETVLRVVVVEEGAGVVVEVERGLAVLSEFNLVWNLLFLLPNLFRVADVKVSGLSVG